MVSGELDGAELARRLQPFGLRDRAAVLVLTPPRPLKAATEDALARALRDEAPAGLAAGTGRFSCVLVAPPRGGGDEELFALAERLRARVSSEVGSDLAAGAGRMVPAGELRRAFHEARCALEARGLADSNGDAAGLATYRDLGSFQLLLSLQDDEALRLFCDSILAPIEEGEGAYGGELMRSLEAFIECNGQWERAARQLYCHRHTLRYRIRRVEELTGRSLDSARDRIDFWLALRGRELTTKGTRVIVGVPTEIKTDEYRVALTPAGVRELVEHGHEVVVQAGRRRGVGDLGRRLPLAGRADPAGRRRGVRRGGHDRQGQGAAARARSRRLEAAPPAVHVPAPGARPRPHARAGRVGRDVRRL